MLREKQQEMLRVTLQEMMHEVHKKNEELRRADTPALLDEEVLAGRMYTGPMYVKYNTILRAKSGTVPALAAKAEEMCKSNYYPSTLQIITAALRTVHAKIAPSDGVTVSCP